MPIVVMKLSHGDDAGGFLGFIKLQAAGKVPTSVGDKVFPSDRSLGTRIRMHATGWCRVPVQDESYL